MRIFHSTPTDSYLPLSHDNSYLFVHYDKIVNFLAFNVDKKYKHILAKPIKNNYQIDWYSPFEGLQVNNNVKQDNTANHLYWQFHAVLQQKINDLAIREDDNTKDWTALLQKVFNPADNVIYTNGNDISIIWGWKFENNDLVKPDLSKILINEDSCSEELSNDFSSEELQFPISEDSRDESRISENDVNEFVEDKPEYTEVFEEEFFSTEEDEARVEVQDKKSFLEFLKYIASKYWWLLILLLIMICLVFFVKSVSL